MVLGHPERVVTALIHALGVLDDLVQRAAQFRLRIAALVDRGAGVPEILHVDCAVIGAVEFRDHRVSSQMPASTVTRARTHAVRQKTITRSLVGRASLPMIATRPRPGTTSRKSSSRLPARSVARVARPVTLPPGRARLATRPLP